MIVPVKLPPETSERIKIDVRIRIIFFEKKYIIFPLINEIIFDNGLKLLHNFTLLQIVLIQLKMVSLFVQFYVYSLMILDRMILHLYCLSQCLY